MINIFDNICIYDKYVYMINIFDKYISLCKGSRNPFLNNFENLGDVLGSAGR